RARAWPPTWPGISRPARARSTPARWTQSWIESSTGCRRDAPPHAVKEERDDESRDLVGRNDGRDDRDGWQRLRHRRASAQRGPEGSRRAEAEAGRDAGRPRQGE